MAHIFSALFVFLSAGSAFADVPVTIQYNVCTPLQGARQALGLESASSKAKTTYIFESRDYALYNGNIQIRLRTKANKATLTVKNFGMGDNVVTALLAKGASCEYDVHGGIKTGSCKFDQELDSDVAAAVISGKSTLDSVISSDQKLVLNYGGDMMAALSRVTPLGPVKDTSDDVTSSDLAFPVALDTSTTPRNTVFIEIKSVANEASWRSQLVTVQSWLKSKGLLFCDDQSGVRLRKFQDLFGN